jgi:hypothetical protein
MAGNIEPLLIPGFLLQKTSSPGKTCNVDRTLFDIAHPEMGMRSQLTHVCPLEKLHDARRSPQLISSR